jgi:hypothetical protein
MALADRFPACIPPILEPSQWILPDVLRLFRSPVLPRLIPRLGTRRPV